MSEKFNKALAEAVALTRKLRIEDAKKKMTADAFIAEACNIADIEPDGPELKRLEKRLGLPQFRAVASFVNRMSMEIGDGNKYPCVPRDFGALAQIIHETA